MSILYIIFSYQLINPNHHCFHYLVGPAQSLLHYLPIELTILFNLLYDSLRLTFINKFDQAKLNFSLFDWCRTISPSIFHIHSNLPFNLIYDCLARNFSNKLIDPIKSLPLSLFGWSQISYLSLFPSRQLQTIFYQKHLI